MRAVTLLGPFTDEELSRIIRVARSIEESRHGGEIFHVFVDLTDDNPGSQEEAQRIMAKIDPPRRGYERQYISWPK